MTLTDLYLSKYAAVVFDTQTMSAGGGKQDNMYVTHEKPKGKHRAIADVYREAARTEPSRPLNAALNLLD